MAVVTMKGYSILLTIPDLEPHLWIKFSVIDKTALFKGESYPSTEDAREQRNI